MASIKTEPSTEEGLERGTRRDRQSERGHVGCCDQSIGKHATAHARETGHHVIRSVALGEERRYCYADETFVE